MASIRRWWTSDTALHTYIYAQTLISLPFSVFGTYTQYQLQAVGYAIGKDSVGGPCVDYCIVPWLGTHMDLNSVLLYMNAFGIGLSGLITLFLAAYSDYWSHKHLLVTIGFVTYGCFTIPVYWLQDTSSYDFNVLSALSIVFTIATNILVAVLNIYVPYCMRENAAAIKASTRSHGHPNVLPSPPSPPSSSNAPIGNASVESSEKRTYGFKMTVIGSFANSIGALIMYIIVIIITETTKNVNAPGLLVATTVGFITVAGASVVYFGLPRLPAKDAEELVGETAGPLIEFTPSTPTAPTPSPP
ncbi:uncharacterized protein MYCGRDRAFT_95601 [Zymoseptoria tritici IPO323]|uniref:Autophagy-related protein n=1 Tax=Zymoseptoria tritici (strain CBS 115943 / IPO323) TaxID=336722 RepID=F9XJ76_ZYMTI|nr:uncharacterized protein MYCGRDRAFT_95601 [Zymoseptoria tritici IPO323]EGP84763.1 hypothetical protein MYCGRDRAFT_95601 [Zymoseptoria tritici IPO323]